MSNPKTLETLTFDKMKRLFEDAELGEEQAFLLSHDLSVLVGVASVIRRAIREGFLVQIPDYRFGFIFSGHARIKMNLIEYELHPGMVAFLSPGSTIEPLEATDDFNLTGMVVSPELLRLALGGATPAFLNGESMGGCLSVGDENHAIVERFFHLLRDVLRKQKSHRVALGLVAALIAEYNFLFERGRGQRRQRLTHAQATFERFIYLVNNHCVREHHLAFYADRMCLSEHYLSMVVRQASGTTAKEWIDRALITQAKIHLMKSNQPVRNVSDALHFPNYSFFSKYFKRLTGKTPMQFRQER